MTPHTTPPYPSHELRHSHCAAHTRAYVCLLVDEAPTPPCFQPHGGIGITAQRSPVSQQRNRRSCTHPPSPPLPACLPHPRKTSIPPPPKGKRADQCASQMSSLASQVCGSSVIMRVECDPHSKTVTGRSKSCLQTAEAAACVEGWCATLQHRGQPPRRGGAPACVPAGGAQEAYCTKEVKNAASTSTSKLIRRPQLA